MADLPASQLLEAFDPRATAFTTTGFSLAEDLEWLDRVRAVKAPVGVVLLSARILEVLIREALKQAGLDVPEQMGQCLHRLKSYGFLSSETFRLLDRLRDLGNKARHALRRTSFDDAEQGYAIALRGMYWYFCEFSEGPKLKGLSIHNQPLDALLPTGIAALLAMLESADLDERGFLDRLGLGKRHCQLLLSPVLAAVLIERLLDDGRHAEAQVVLTAGLGRFADDVRLRQLQGLLWSRTGGLADACALLESIETTDSAADEETQGILAGAYKRRMDAHPEQRDQWLKECHRKYERGWLQSQRSNAYLGINAAATALWLGENERSTAIALNVHDLMEARQHQLASPDGPEHILSLWDQLTLAEARLLLKDWPGAGAAFRVAVEHYPNQTSALELARAQAKKNLAALGRLDMIATVLP